MWLRSIWYILTLRCDEADRLRVVARGGEIARHEKIAERIHRGLCAGCRRAAKQLETIDRGLRDLGGAEAEPHPEWDGDRQGRMAARFSEAVSGDQSSND
jgi:hypothetical protein